MIADFARFAGFFGADFEFKSRELGRAVEGLSCSEGSKNDGGPGFLGDGDLEDAPDDAVHDDHRVLGGFPLGAGFLMDATDDVGLHHAEASVIEASEGDALEDQAGVDGALEVFQEKAKTRKVVRILGLGVGEKNDVGLGLNFEATQQVGNRGQGGEAHGIVGHAGAGDAFGADTDGVALLRRLGEQSVGVGGDENVELGVLAGDDGLEVALLVDGNVLKGRESLSEEIDSVLFRTRRRRKFTQHEGVGENEFLVGLKLVAEFGQVRHESLDGARVTF